MSFVGGGLFSKDLADCECIHTWHTDGHQWGIESLDPGGVQAPTVEQDGLSSVPSMSILMPLHMCTDWWGIRSVPFTKNTNVYKYIRKWLNVLSTTVTAGVGAAKHVIMVYVVFAQIYHII